MARPLPSQRPTEAMPSLTSGDSSAARATIVAVSCGVPDSGRPTAASSAWSPTDASQQPVRPQPQDAVASPIGRWPTSPAKPRAPRSSRRPSTIPAPMPTVPVR